MFNFRFTLLHSFQLSFLLVSNFVFSYELPQLLCFLCTSSHSCRARFKVFSFSTTFEFFVRGRSLRQLLLQQFNFLNVLSIKQLGQRLSVEKLELQCGFVSSLSLLLSLSRSISIYSLSAALAYCKCFRMTF